MFTLPDKISNEFRELFETHRVQISAMDVFYQNIRMLNNRHKILDRDTYAEYVKNILNDVELVSSPIDSFIPEEANDDELFVVNRSVPEYEKIKARMTPEFIYSILPATHNVVMTLKDDATKLETIIDDMFIYYSLFKYLDQIDKIRLMIYSNTTPIIEYVVCNIDEKVIKNHLVSKRINEEKYAEKGVDIFFNPDVAITQKFYATAHESYNIPAFDVVNLMMRLITNITIKSDIYIILGIYTTLSFAMSDIANENIDTSPCAEYVRDVLSKI